MVAAFDFCLHGRGGAAPSIDTAMQTNLANIDQYGPNLLSNGNFTPNQEWVLNSPL